jgi:hypothetical protein
MICQHEPPFLADDREDTPAFKTPRMIGSIFRIWKRGPGGRIGADAIFLQIISVTD